MSVASPPLEIVQYLRFVVRVLVDSVSVPSSFRFLPSVSFELCLSRRLHFGLCLAASAVAVYETARLLRLCPLFRFAPLRSCRFRRVISVPSCSRGFGSFCFISFRSRCV